MIKHWPTNQIKKICIALLCGNVLIACNQRKEKQSKARILPIVGERDVVYRTVNGQDVADTLYHHVPEFEYRNQDSLLVHSKQLKDRVWVTDFFFTHCPSICPPMTTQMKRLNQNTSDIANYLYFLSFSIDPERDTPERLRTYKKEYQITANNWHFFTGEEVETHILAKEFFNGAERTDVEDDGNFGHTSYFALVDKNGLVRGIYDGTVAKEVDKLEADLRKLLKYEYGVNGKEN